MWLEKELYPSLLMSSISRLKPVIWGTPWYKPTGKQAIQDLIGLVSSLGIGEQERFCHVLKKAFSSLKYHLEEKVVEHKHDPCLHHCLAYAIGDCKLDHHVTNYCRTCEELERTIVNISLLEILDNILGANRNRMISCIREMRGHFIRPIIQRRAQSAILDCRTSLLCSRLGNEDS